MKNPKINIKVERFHKKTVAGLRLNDNFFLFENFKLSHFRLSYYLTNNSCHGLTMRELFIFKTEAGGLF